MWKGRCKAVKLFIREAHVLVLNSRFSALSVWLSCLELVWVSGGYIIIMDFLGWWVEAIVGYPECHTWDDRIPIIPEFPESFPRQTGRPLCRASWAVSLGGWRGCELLSNCANRFLTSQPRVISRTRVSALHTVQTRVSVFICSFSDQFLSWGRKGAHVMYILQKNMFLPDIWLLWSHLFVAPYITCSVRVSSGECLQREASFAGNYSSLCCPFSSALWIGESGGKRLHHDFERKVVDKILK